MYLTSLRFSIAGGSYQQVMAWMQEIDQSVLHYQLNNRGQALVVPRDGSGNVRKVSEMPDLDRFEPYYGAQGGAYRFSFHPLNDACELEVVNQMGGFAFYYPQRFDPLHLYLFQPPEQVDHGGEGMGDPLLDDRFTCLCSHTPAEEKMEFFISPPLYAAFQDWAWSRRPLYAYDFVFLPGGDDCQVRIRARESGILLELTQERTL